MLADLPPFLQKLWDRGIDIGVGVTTSVMVAIIGLCFWRLKLWLDLRAEARKQRQQHRIAEELGNQQREQNGRELHARLARERDGFAKAAAAAGNQYELAEVWEKYVTWLEANELQSLPGNLTTLIRYPNWSQGLRATPREDLDGHRRTTEQLVRETELLELKS